MRLSLTLTAVAWIFVACRPSQDVVLERAEVVSIATAVGAAPMYALAPSGSRTIAWVSAPDGGTDGRLYTSTNGMPASELRDPAGGIEPHGEAPPKLVYAPDGTLYALYAVGRVVPGRRFPFTTLRMSRSRDYGRSWERPRSVGGDSVPGSRNFHALHVDRHGALYVAWLEAKDGAKSGTYLTRSDDGGATWTPAVRVAVDEECPCCRTAIATAPDGTLYLSWRTVLPGNIRDIVIASSRDRGRTWSLPARVHADDFVFEGCPHAGPSMQVDDQGSIHIAWWTGREGAAGVYYARSDSGAGGFGSPVPLGVATFARPAHVQLALDGPDRMLIAWDDARDSLPQVMLRVSRDGGMTFGEAAIASEPGVAATFPVLAVQDGSLTLAWARLATTAHSHDFPATHEKDRAARMPLPSVGSQQVVVRAGRIVP